MFFARRYFCHGLLTQALTNQRKRYWNEKSAPLFPFGFWSELRKVRFFEPAIQQTASK
jgi:hypothetical protein